jgi:RNA polymerase sigma factor (sigma-70 family)
VALTTSDQIKSIRNHHHRVANSASESPDADLCELISANEFRSAFEFLLDRYQHKVFRLACSILGNETQAEDLAQDIFVRIWKGLPGFNGKASLSTWIYTISRNACWTELRKRAARQTVPFASDGDGLMAEESDRAGGAEPEVGARIDVEYLLGKLEEKYRRAGHWAGVTQVVFTFTPLPLARLQDPETIFAMKTDKTLLNVRVAEVLTLAADAMR